MDMDGDGWHLEGDMLSLSGPYELRVEVRIVFVSLVYRGGRVGLRRYEADRRIVGSFFVRVLVPLNPAFRRLAALPSPACHLVIAPVLSSACKRKQNPAAIRSRICQRRRCEENRTSASKERATVWALDDGIHGLVVDKRQVDIYALLQHATDDPVFDPLAETRRVTEAHGMPGCYAGGFRNVNARCPYCVVLLARCESVRDLCRPAHQEIAANSLPTPQTLFRSRPENRPVILPAPPAAVLPGGRHRVATRPLCRDPEHPHWRVRIPAFSHTA